MQLKHLSCQANQYQHFLCVFYKKQYTYFTWTCSEFYLCLHNNLIIYSIFPIWIKTLLFWNSIRIHGLKLIAFQRNLILHSYTKMKFNSFENKLYYVWVESNSIEKFSWKPRICKLLYSNNFSKFDVYAYTNHKSFK